MKPPKKTESAPMETEGRSLFIEKVPALVPDWPIFM